MYPLQEMDCSSFRQTTEQSGAVDQLALPLGKHDVRGVQVPAAGLCRDSEEVPGPL